MMKLRAQIKSTLDRFDALIASALLPAGAEQPGILTFVFHGLFASEQEAQSGVVDPQQTITVALFREFIAYFRERHYQFISESDLEKGALAAGKYIFITFDDGYRNNLRALPILEEFQVPAVFCFCSNHIRQQKCFWWDALFREMKKRGKSDDAIHAAGAKYKRFTNAEIELLLKEQFGESV